MDRRIFLKEVTSAAVFGTIGLGMARRDTPGAVKDGKPQKKSVFPHRVCYVNHGEHCLNSWNANLIYPDVRDQWTREDWRKFLHMLKSFGYTSFQYWLVPTMFDLPSLEGGGIYEWYSQTMSEVADIAHAEQLEIECLLMLNVWGPKWFYACPNIPEERAILRKLWRHWISKLSGVDVFAFHPGDLGGCNLNGCTHETAVELCLEITDIIKRESPKTRIQIGTWGTFCGWGSDSVEVPGWNRSAVDLMRSGFYNYINRDFHGTVERTKAAFEYLAKRLPEFPNDTVVAINRGIDGTPGDGVDQGSRGACYAKEISKLRPIVTWDYYVSEGEGMVLPHWRLDSMSKARQAEHAAAPYIGGICYTMSPKLNLLNLYGGAQTFIDPQVDPTELARNFYGEVFGQEHKELGELMKTFECNLAKNDLHKAFGQIIEHLESAKPSSCTLPIFPDPETYRQDLLWFAQKFHEMTGPNPNRALIAWEYWDKAYGIYQHVPMGSINAEKACKKFADSFSKS